MGNPQSTSRNNVDEDAEKNAEYKRSKLVTFTFSYQSNNSFKSQTDHQNFCLNKTEKDSAEAKVGDFKFEFRKNDPDNRLRVQAIIEKTVDQAQKKL